MQVDDVLLGSLLDAWDGLPTDLKDQIKEASAVLFDRLNQLRKEVEGDEAGKTDYLLALGGGPPGAENLFWSNRQGWDDIHSARRFTFEEREQFQIPMGGDWIDAGAVCAECGSMARSKCSACQQANCGDCLCSCGQPPMAMDEPISPSSGNYSGQ